MLRLNVAMVGERAVGKTVFLASLFERLGKEYRGDPDRSLYVWTEMEATNFLAKTYGEIKNPTLDWPFSTRRGETREFVFVLYGRSANGADYPLFEIGYMDYAGERGTGIKEDATPEQEYFKSYLKNADVLVGMLDGRRLLSLIRESPTADVPLGPAGRQYVDGVLQPTLLVMLDNVVRCRVHFVISKWDLLADAGITLDRVLSRLSAIADFRRLATMSQRYSLGSIRVIPVSSVGRNFTQLYEGEMKKIPNGELMPENVEIPFFVAFHDVYTLIRVEERSRLRLPNLRTTARRMLSGAEAIIDQSIRETYADADGAGRRRELAIMLAKNSGYVVFSRALTGGQMPRRPRTLRQRRHEDRISAYRLAAQQFKKGLEDFEREFPRAKLTQRESR